MNPSTTADNPGKIKIFSIGTLRYTKVGLWLLFFWLLWNDLFLMLMEQVAPQLVPIMLKDYGASNRDIALFTSTLTGVFTIWINPVVSTWSDNYRSKAGRRRPFLFFATPPCAIALGAIPFMPDLVRWLARFPLLHPYFSGPYAVILLIGVSFITYSVFNSIILAIFSYYFWDVVPDAVLGRFTALTKIISTLAIFLWNFYFFGMTEKYLKEVFVIIAAGFLVAYLISLWQVKEGQYPPAEQKNDSAWSSVKSYFSVCFTKPYFLWFFAANSIYQIGNVANNFQIFLFRDELGMSLDTIGKMRALPTLIVVLMGYPMGSLVDRLKPGRIIIASMFLYAVCNIAAFFFLRDQWSMLFFMGLFALIVCAIQVSVGVFTVEFFPRERLGQFCSANAMIYHIFQSLLAAYVLGILFDWIKDYRYAFAWSALFQIIAAFFFLKVYRNYQKKLTEQ